jgi:hypothetical protein
MFEAFNRTIESPPSLLWLLVLIVAPPRLNQPEAVLEESSRHLDGAEADLAGFHDPAGLRATTCDVL